MVVGGNHVEGNAAERVWLELRLHPSVNKLHVFTKNVRRNVIHLSTPVCNSSTLIFGRQAKLPIGSY